MTLKYRILPDPDPENPRDWDNLGIMCCFHKRYNLGDHHTLLLAGREGWAELEQHLVEEEGALYILPLFLYDHSGITMNTTSFSCGWDSGQVGFIYATKETIESTGVAPENVEAGLIDEVKTYDQYLTGDVWGYEVYLVETCNKGHEHEEIIHSCWGFYDESDAENEAKCLAVNDEPFHPSDPMPEDWNNKEPLS